MMLLCALHTQRRLTAMIATPITLLRRHATKKECEPLITSEHKSTQHQKEYYETNEQVNRRNINIVKTTTTPPLTERRECGREQSNQRNELLEGLLGLEFTEFNSLVDTLLTGNREKAHIDKETYKDKEGNKYECNTQAQSKSEQKHSHANSKHNRGASFQKQNNTNVQLDKKMEEQWELASLLAKTLEYESSISSENCNDLDKNQQHPKTRSGSQENEIKRQERVSPHNVHEIKEIVYKLLITSRKCEEIDEAICSDNKTYKVDKQCASEYVNRGSNDSNSHNVNECIEQNVNATDSNLCNAIYNIIKKWLITDWATLLHAAHESNNIQHFCIVLIVVEEIHNQIMELVNQSKSTVTSNLSECNQEKLLNTEEELAKSISDFSDMLHKTSIYAVRLLSCDSLEYCIYEDTLLFSYVQLVNTFMFTLTKTMSNLKQLAETLSLTSSSSHKKYAAIKPFIVQDIYEALCTLSSYMCVLCDNAPKYDERQQADLLKIVHCLHVHTKRLLTFLKWHHAKWEKQWQGNDHVELIRKERWVIMSICQSNIIALTKFCIVPLCSQMSSQYISEQIYLMQIANAIKSSSMYIEQLLIYTFPLNSNKIDDPRKVLRTMHLPLSLDLDYIWREEERSSTNIHHFRKEKQQTSILHDGHPHSETCQQFYKQNWKEAVVLLINVHDGLSAMKQCVECVCNEQNVNNNVLSTQKEKRYNEFNIQRQKHKSHSAHLSLSSLVQSNLLEEETPQSTFVSASAIFVRTILNMEANISFAAARALNITLAEPLRLAKSEDSTTMAKLINNKTFMRLPKANSEFQYAWETVERVCAITRTRASMFIEDIFTLLVHQEMSVQSQADMTEECTETEYKSTMPTSPSASFSLSVIFLSKIKAVFYVLMRRHWLLTRGCTRLADTMAVTSVFAKNNYNNNCEDKSGEIECNQQSSSEGEERISSNNLEYSSKKASMSISHSITIFLKEHWPEYNNTILFASCLRVYLLIGEFDTCHNANISSHNAQPITEQNLQQMEEPETSLRMPENAELSEKVATSVSTTRVETTINDRYDANGKERITSKLNTLNLSKSDECSVCGITLAQALDVMFFLTYFQSKWGISSVTGSDANNAISDDDNDGNNTYFTNNSSENNSKNEMEGNFGFCAELGVSGVDIKSYVKKVLHRLVLATNTEKRRYWAYVKAKNSLTSCTNDIMSCTNPIISSDAISLYDDLELQTRSLLCVTVHHLYHPSLPWMPLWQLQELLYVLASHQDIIYNEQTTTTTTTTSSETSLSPSGVLEESEKAELQEFTDLITDSYSTDNLSVNGSGNSNVQSSSINGNDDTNVEYEQHVSHSSCDEMCNENRREVVERSRHSTLVVQGQFVNFSGLHKSVMQRLYLITNVLRQLRDELIKHEENKNSERGAHATENVVCDLETKNSLNAQSVLHTTHDCKRGKSANTRFYEQLLNLCESEMKGERSKREARAWTSKYVRCLCEENQLLPAQAEGVHSRKRGQLQVITRLELCIRDALQHRLLVKKANTVNGAEPHTIHNTHISEEVPTPWFCENKETEVSSEADDSEKRLLMNADIHAARTQDSTQISAANNQWKSSNENVITLHLTRTSTNESLGFVLDKNSTRIVRLTCLYSRSDITLWDVDASADVTKMETPIQIAARAAGIQNCSHLLDCYITHVNGQKVQQKVDVINLTQGKLSINLTLEKKEELAAPVI